MLQVFKILRQRCGVLFRERRPAVSEQGVEIEIVGVPTRHSFVHVPAELLPSRVLICSIQSFKGGFGFCGGVEHERLLLLWPRGGTRCTQTGTGGRPAVTGGVGNAGVGGERPPGR